MARPSQHHTNGGVWPGYVAAVAGLVQSLLFVAAVVATVVYLLGMLGSQQSVKPAPLLAHSTPQGAPVPKNPWGASPEYRLPKGFEPLELVFPPGQIELDAASKKRLSQAVIRWQQQGAVQWRLIGHLKADDELSARRAYFRLQVLRTLLIEQGVDPRTLENRVLPAQPPVHTEHQVVLLAAPAPSPRVGRTHD